MIIIYIIIIWLTMIYSTNGESIFLLLQQQPKKLTNYISHNNYNNDLMYSFKCWFLTFPCYRKSTSLKDFIFWSTNQTSSVLYKYGYHSTSQMVPATNPVNTHLCWFSGWFRSPQCFLVVSFTIHFDLRHRCPSTLCLGVPSDHCQFRKVFQSVLEQSI